MYKIIQDIDHLERFVSILPELKDDECYFFLLQTRRKYGSIKDYPLRKFIVTEKKYIIDDIKKLEVQTDLYKIRKTPVSNNELVLYMNPNPRSMKVAAVQLINELVSLVADNKSFQFESKVYSHIQKSKSRRVFIHIDIDNPNFEFKELDNTLGNNAIFKIKTKSGFHILIDITKIPSRRIISKLFIEYKNQIDKNGDMLTPIPGCVQGDTTPLFLI